MEIFTSLGLDETLFVQMGVFLVVFVVLKKLLFEPYFAAYRERKERTVGQTEAAERYVNEARELEQQYSSKAQQINQQFKSIYDQSRVEAMKEYDQVIQVARNNSKQWTEQARSKIQKEVREAREKMSPDIPAISQLITAKLMGKESIQ